MNRPLFEEPTTALERTDPSEGPPGFMIGGMANLTFQHLGHHYFDAAYLLLETIRNGDWDDHRLANPVLYLYRHSIELFLKAALGNAAKTHDLAGLSDLACRPFLPVCASGTMLACNDPAFARKTTFLTLACKRDANVIAKEIAVGV